MYLANISDYSSTLNIKNHNTNKMLELISNPFIINSGRLPSPVLLVFSIP